MHKRGKVVWDERPPQIRSSVWINQEVAIFSYRVFLEQGRHTPVRVYQQRGIAPEGLAGFSLLNPIEFRADAEVLAGLGQWLSSRELADDPIVARREDLFARRITGLREKEWLVLELIAAQSIGGGEEVSLAAMFEAFGEVAREQGGKYDPAEPRVAIDYLVRSRLVNRSTPSKGEDLTKDGLRIAPQWWDLVLDELRQRGHHS